MEPGTHDSNRAALDGLTVTYEYICKDGHEFEAEQSIVDEPLTECIVPIPDGLPCNGPVPCGAPCKREIRTPRGFVCIGYGWSKDGYG